MLTKRVYWLLFFCLGCYQSMAPSELDAAVDHSEQELDGIEGAEDDTEDVSSGSDTVFDSDQSEGDSDLDSEIHVDTEINVGTDTGDSDSSDNGDSGTDLEQAFITVWKTDMLNEQEDNEGDTCIELPLVPNGNYDFTVNWGDGFENTVDSWDAEGASHCYSEPGTYEIRIVGTLSGWSFCLKENAEKLLRVENWGSMAFGDTTGQFGGCHNLTITATDVPDLSETQSLKNLFFECGALTEVPQMHLWDMSSIRDMSWMFYRAVNFNQDIGAWDTSNVTNMFGMFYLAKTFNQDISGWDTSGVVSMNRMFPGAESFNQDISLWDTSSVVDMGMMFGYALAFNQDLSSWDVSNVSYMRHMFSQAVAFNQDLSSWDVSSVTDMFSMFEGATVFNQDISSWDVSNVTQMGKMFFGAAAFNQNLSAWDVSGVWEMDNLLADTSLSTLNYDALLVGWEGQTVQNNVTIDVGNVNYSPGLPAEARSRLIAEHGWTIKDGGETVFK